MLRSFNGWTAKASTVPRAGSRGYAHVDVKGVSWDSKDIGDGGLQRGFHGA